MLTIVQHAKADYIVSGESHRPKSATAFVVSSCVLLGTNGHNATLHSRAHGAP